MRHFLLASLFLLVMSTPAFALIVTDNVDETDFMYEVAYPFATNDLAVSQTAVEIPIIPGADDHNFYFGVPRAGRIVGMAVTATTDVAAGAATFDVTINGTVTGVQTVLEVQQTSARSAAGNSGSAGSRVAYIRQDRDETNAAQGFRGVNDRSTSFHDSDNVYGRATPISAGDRIGVRVTSSSGLSPVQDYTVVIYVLE